TGTDLLFRCAVVGRAAVRQGERTQVMQDVVPEGVGVFDCLKLELIRRSPIGLALCHETSMHHGPHGRGTMAEIQGSQPAESSVLRPAFHLGGAAVGGRGATGRSWSSGMA